MSKLGILLSTILPVLLVIVSGTTGQDGSSGGAVSNAATTALNSYSCANGTILETEAAKFLDEINTIREMVRSGVRPNGNSGMLPPAISMLPLNWSCALQETALTLLEKDTDCPVNLTSRSIENAHFFYNDTKNTTTISDVLSQQMMSWNKTQLNVTYETKVTRIVYNNELDLQTYANLIRETTTEIGCARRSCLDQNNATIYSVLCVTSQKPLAQGETIYSSPANACPANTGMTNAIRKEILRKHNELRSQLAIGATSKGTTGLCRPAVQIPELVYDCNLEKAAYEQAKKCDNTASTAAPYTENSGSITRFMHAPFGKAATLAIQRWWSEKSNLPATFCRTRNIYTKNMKANFFATLASEQTTKVGCGVYNCTGMLNVVCHYDTKLTDGQTLYKMGTKKVYCRCLQSKCDASFPGLCTSSVTNQVTLY